MQRRLQIVGGGVTGLTLALRMAQRGWTVEVHEAEPFLGGLSATTRVADTTVDRYYHCVLPGDLRLLELFEEVGIRDQVSWRKTRTGFFVDDRLLDMTTTIDFLRFPAISLVDRLRLAWTILYCSFFVDGTRLDDVSLIAFLRKHSGGRLYERIWQPLLVGKLGPDHERFAAGFIWGTIQRMMSARRSKERSESLGYLRGGYSTALQAMRKELERRGGTVVSPSRVEGLEARANGQYALLTSEGKTQPAPTVLCVPAPLAAKWSRDVATANASTLDQIEYLGVVCEVLVLRRSLTPYYVLNPAERGLPFTGVIETSNLTGRAEFDGNAVVYLPRYRSSAHTDFDASDESIHAENFEGLRRVAPDLDPEDVLGWAIHRARHVQPIHSLGYAKRIPSIALAEGLGYLSTAQIHPWPVFNDEVVRHVDRSLPQIEALLTGSEGAEE